MWKTQKSFKNTSLALCGLLSASLALSACLQVKATGIKSKLAEEVADEESAVLLDVDFASTTISLPIGSAYDSGAPTVTNGPIVSCAVSPALPTGLSLDTSTCRVTGTPTALSATASYDVIATGAENVVTISVSLEVHDVAPAIAYSSATYNFSMGASSTTGAPTNTGGAIASCSIDHAVPAGLTFNTSSCVISGTPTSVSAADSFAITATNAYGSSAVQTISIEVLNIAPNISFTGSPYVFNLFAASSSGAPSNSGGAITSCAVTPALPAGLSVSQTTCEISGTPSAVVAAANYTVTPTNGIGSGTGRVVSIEVANVVPNIAYSGGSYNFSLNAASSSGTPTNTGGAITGCTVDVALPTGLSLNTSDCTISGTPTVVTAAANYTITPSNAIGNGTARTLSITVSNVVPNITYGSGTYSFSLNASSTTGAPSNSGGAITGCTVDVALPTGLSLNTSTCTISGTPTVVTAAANYTITPSNAIGNGTARVLSIEVLNVVPNIAYSSGSYNFSLNSVSNTGSPTNTGGAITGCTSDIALPTGLSINTSTCRISGTPTAVTAATNYTITPSNGIGNGTARVISIEVLNVAPSIAYSSSSYAFDILSAATTGVPENSGGAITGCSVDVALPTGLSLNTSNCTISGTPTTVVADAIYTITPSNAIGSGTSQALNIKTRNIVPSLGYTGAPYTFTKNSAATGTATNSGGAITGCSSSPALPTGLSLSSTTCSISGTPTVAAATASYTITPSNEIGSGAARTISITVNDPPTISTVSPTNLAVCGLSGTVTITGTGFVSGASVTYGGSSCGSVTVGSSTSLTCSYVFSAQTSRNVVVTNPDGSSVTKTNALPMVCPI